MNAARSERAVGLSCRVANTMRRCPSPTRCSTARCAPYQWSEHTESRACSALPRHGRRSISTVGTPTPASHSWSASSSARPRQRGAISSPSAPSASARSTSGRSAPDACGARCRAMRTPARSSTVRAPCRVSVRYECRTGTTTATRSPAAGTASATISRAGSVDRTTPCPRLSLPSRVSSSTSRRTVTTETCNSSARSRTRAVPRAWTAASIRWRLRSTGSRIRSPHPRMFV
ncbi:hypothetical protein SVIOM342S_09671 [Streptomyces violaceorubidus]